MENSKKSQIICEEAYADSIWCKHLFNGLLKELKKRRISYGKQSAPVQIGNSESIYLVGVSHQWLEQTIRQCNDQDCVPIVLTNLAGRTVKGRYHYICPNTLEAMEKLKTACDKAGRYSAAMYGISHKSDLDMERMRIFSKVFKETGNVYQNNGNLENCFRSFLPYAEKYDVVICGNGYTALSLVKKLEKEAGHLLEKLVIVSWEEVLKHSKFNHWITVVDLNLESFGAAAVTVSEMISGKTGIAAVTVEMESKPCDIPAKAERESLTDTEEGFFEDPELISMAKIEQLLTDADDMDHHIIAMLLDNARYSDIADSCYMTEGNVKYRVKKYMSICGCKTKKELLELLQEYLQ